VLTDFGFSTCDARHFGVRADLCDRPLSVTGAPAFGLRAASRDHRWPPKWAASMWAQQPFSLSPDLLAHAAVVQVAALGYQTGTLGPESAPFGMKLGFDIGGTFSPLSPSHGGGIQPFSRETSHERRFPSCWHSHGCAKSLFSRLPFDAPGTPIRCSGDRVPMLQGHLSLTTARCLRWAAPSADAGLFDIRLRNVRHLTPVHSTLRAGIAPIR
jgi:hypothetical protein